ncbi:MAG TPA: cation:proton antiporter [Pseudobdellovibrionaceae bacterium]|jgi:Kef-type K+ transport system membrane component KefB
MFLFIYILIGIFLGPSFVNIPASQLGTSSLDLLFSLCSFGFLFIAGLELKVEALRKDFLSSAKIAAGAFALPFAVGLIFFQGSSVVALALAISALPVVVQILKDLKLYETRQGHLIVASATLCDIFAWLLFTVAIPNDARGSWILSHLPVFFFFLGLGMSRGARRSETLLKIVLGSSRFFFGPVFFIGVGMKIHWQESFDLNQCLTILGVASISKMVGVYLTSRAIKFDHRDATLMAIVLNARGAMEILFCSIALKLGLIDSTLFTSLTLMAVLSSVIASPLVKLFIAL